MIRDVHVSQHRQQEWNWHSASSAGGARAVFVKWHFSPVLYGLWCDPISWFFPSLRAGLSRLVSQSSLLAGWHESISLIKEKKRAFFFSNVKHTESSKPHFPSLFMHDIPCTVYLTVWHQLTCGWVKLKLIAAWLLWNESFKMGISVWLDVGFLFITELQKWQLSQDSVDRGRGCMLEGERGSL